MDSQLDQNLWKFATNGDYENTRQALIQGANPNYAQLYQPLLCAIHPAHGSILRLLLLAGANPNATDIDGRTAAICYIQMTFGVMGGGIPTPQMTLDAIIELFIAGAEPNIKDRRGHDLKYYIMHRIPSWDNPWRIEYLIALRMYLKRR